MLTTCKALVTGKRKGQQCEFPKSQTNDYCGKHQRNYLYEQLINDGKIPCRLFFRGCDAVVSVKGSCDDCREKLASKKKPTNCSYEACIYRTNGAKYCGKHLREAFHDEEKEKGIKYCNVERGCFKLCEKEYTRCKECRNQENQCDRELRKVRTEMHNVIEKNPNITMQICLDCGKNFEKFKTGHGKPSMRCRDCNKRVADQDAKRVDRERNYKNEYFKNLESHFKSYIHSALKRNYAVNINFDDFKSLVTKECHYCGYLKDQEVNGIDRINNDIGYEKSNCVSCCEVCNMMKHYYHPLFFIELCKIISGKTEPTKKFYTNWKEYYGRSNNKNFANYVKESKSKRDIEVKITQEDWDKITRQPCYLCGFRDAKGIGIDRVDNTKREYSLDNIKACCGTCNSVKNDFPLETIKQKANIVANKWKDTSIFISVPRTKNPMRECSRKNEIIEPEERKIWKAEGVYYDIISDTNDFVCSQVDLEEAEYNELLEVIQTKTREEIIPHIRALLAKLNKRRRR